MPPTRDSGPSDPSVHVDIMVGSLVGATLGMVLVAACGAACRPELAGDAGRYRGELIWAARACASAT